jgi:hypothetical protein
MQDIVANSTRFTLPSILPRCSFHMLSVSSALTLFVSEYHNRILDDSDDDTTGLFAEVIVT